MSKLMPCEIVELHILSMLLQILEIHITHRRDMKKTKKIIFLGQFMLTTIIAKYNTQAYVFGASRQNMLPICCSGVYTVGYPILISLLIE